MPSAVCHVCQAESSSTCSRCGVRNYCGPACQKKDWPTHSPTCRPREQASWLLKITAGPGGEIKDPMVTRTLICPDTATFDQLHFALQIAFGWSTTHWFDFVAKDPRARKPRQLSLSEHIRKRQLQDAGEPFDSGPRQNFMRITIPNPVMLMRNRYLSAAESIHGRDRHHPQTPERPAHKVFVGEQLRKWEGAEWEYLYDFGDYWEHQIQIIGRGNIGDAFKCVDGQGHGVAEDCRGYDGWTDLKSAYRKANPSADNKERMEWFEKDARNRDPLGLGNGRELFWDKDSVNRELGLNPYLRIR